MKRPHQPRIGAHAGRLAIAGSSLALALPAQEQTTPQALAAADTRLLLEQWVETRKLISDERRDHALGRQLLQDRIAIVRREIEQLKGRIADTDKSAADAAARQNELSATKNSLARASDRLREQVVGLEGRVRALIPRLPEPLRERLTALTQRLPQESSATTASLSERFQNVLGILNEVGKWNREVSTATELRQVAGGAGARVTTMYLGLGQAWYSTQKGDAAGFGSVGPDGWVWTAAKEVAPDILRAIAIQKGEQTAAFVRLPVRMQ